MIEKIEKIGNRDAGRQVAAQRSPKLSTLNHQLSTRRGSALLIVMGMFAFMIVSAVSFSVYMRSSRTPSSYARRNTLTRQIVRAALARAMDEVDTAVGNDPFPGFGKNHVPGKGLNNPLDTHNDDWVGRVFTPSNECPFSSTVPTLTLEGLGYLPPALINEVRYGSRHTRTAQWRSFSYGLGRYAFTAVNVSDFFDLSEFEDGVNMNRSSAPGTRVTPAYLFSEAAKSQDDGARFNDVNNSDLSKFCQGVDPGQSGLDGVPLVSMMDYNLWMGHEQASLLEYPFFRSISGGNSDSAAFAYQDKAKVMPQLFIAGGWSGKESSGGGSGGGSTLKTQIDLQNPEQQPFYGWSGFPNKANLDAVFNDEIWRNSQNAVDLEHSSGSSRNVPQQTGELIPAITQCLLYDYLDYDSIPLSLALPCTEETPMLVYVNLDNCVNWKTVVDAVERTEPGATPDEPAKKFVKKTYKLQFRIEGMVNLGTVYPFLNNPRNGKTFKTDCFVRVFLAQENNRGLRDTGGGLKLEPNNVGSGGFLWADLNNRVRQPTYLQVKTGQVSVKAVGSDAAANAVDLVNPLNFDWTTEIVLAEIDYEVDDNGNLKPPLDAAKKSGHDLGSDFSVLANDWTVTPVTDSATPFDETQGTTGTPKYYPSAAIWVRISVEGDDEAVDLVPATLSYDNIDGKRGFTGNDMLRIATGSRPGDGTPLLRFLPRENDTAVGIEFNGKFFVDNAGNEKNVQWDYPTYSANDPRYNWAPEDWVANSGTDPKAGGWLTMVQDFQKNHKEQCDTDIYMQVSNQGYLQSMYELMMVPQVSPMGRHGTMDIFIGRLLERASVRPYNGGRRTAFNDTVNNELMWRTYKSDAFLYDTDRRSDTGYRSSITWKEWGTIEDLRSVESTAGLRANPYTDITNLFVGAIANMPRDWWAAGTNWNDTTGLKKYMDPKNGDAHRLKDEYLLDCTINRKDAVDISRFMMSEFRHDATAANSNTNGGWLVWSEVMDVWNWLMPDGERFDRWNMSGTDDDMDSIMADLLSVERKFMYGYLKGCFANTKQLFLIFVRAEPSDGGGGGRAVALVWRDPNSKYSDDNSERYLQKSNALLAEETWRLLDRSAPPHNMRILFYHQFE